MTDPPNSASPLTTLRSRVERRMALARELGVRGLLEIETETRWRLFKATLGATVAWELTALGGSSVPSAASLAAILVVQATVRATLARAVQLTIGITAGLVIAIALGNLLGLHWWTIGIIVLGGLLVGEILRLGPFAAQAAISALLAFSLGSNYGALRIVDTIVGALVGVAINTLISPPNNVAKTAETLRRIAEDLGGLLTDMGSGLNQHLRIATADRWLERARDVAADVRDTREILLQARESVAFNPLSKTTDDHLERLNEARRALDHSTSQVRGIARALSDLLGDRILPAEDNVVLRLLGPTIAQVGHAIAAFGRLQEDPTSTPNREHAVAAHAAAVDGYYATREAVTNLSDNGRLAAADTLLLSSIVVDVERLIQEVDVSENGAHAAAVAPAAG